MRDFDPAVMYPTMRPEAPRPPTERMRAEAAEYANLYPSMRGEIEAQYGVNLPPEGEAAPSAPGTGPEGGAERDTQTIVAWADAARAAPEVTRALRSAVEAADALPPEARASTSDGWAGEASARFGSRLGEVARLARTAVPPDLMPILDRTGLGNHPDVIAFFYEVALNAG